MDSPAIEAIGSVTGALNSAIECALAADGDVWTNADAAESAVQECLRDACAEAHRHDMRVEKVLILLKQVCMNHGNSRVLQRASDGRSIYDNLVTALVNEYYML